MIIEVNGQQVEVDDGFAKLAPDQQQAELAHITNAISPPKASVEVRGATDEDLINPLYSTIGGAIAGEVAGPAVNKATAAYQANKEARLGKPVGATGAAPNVNSASPGQKYSAKTGYGSGTGYTVEEVVAHKKAQEKPIGKGKISGKIAGNSPMNVDKMMMLEAEQKAEAARRAAAVSQPASLGSKIMSKMPGAVQDLGAAASTAAKSGVVPWLGRGLAGAGAAYQGSDALNRLQKGDIPGAVIGGIGTAGSLASFIPTPATRFGGAAVGLGAEALNSYLDKLKQGKDEDQSNIQEKAAGGSVVSTKVKSLSDYLDQLMQQAASAPAPAQAPQGGPQGAPQQGGMALPPELQQAALQQAQQPPGASMSPPANAPSAAQSPLGGLAQQMAQTQPGQNFSEGGLALAKYLGYKG